MVEDWQTRILAHTSGAAQDFEAFRRKRKAHASAIVQNGQECFLWSRKKTTLMAEEDRAEKGKRVEKYVADDSNSSHIC